MAFKFLCILTPSLQLFLYHFKFFRRVTYVGNDNYHFFPFLTISKIQLWHPGDDDPRAGSLHPCVVCKFCFLVFTLDKSNRFIYKCLRWLHSIMVNIYALYCYRCQWFWASDNVPSCRKVWSSGAGSAADRLARCSALLLHLQFGRKTSRRNCALLQSHGTGYDVWELQRGQSEK